MNQQRIELNTLLNIAEEAFAERERTARQYDAAREAVNAKLDEMEPRAELTPEDVRRVLSDRRVRLIKLVRDASLKHVSNLRAQSAEILPLGLSLREAKEIVDQWIELQQ